MTIYVNESSAMTVQARFFSRTGDLVTPTNARYLIRDLSNDRVVRDWTSLTPASTIEIPIAASENDIYEHSRRPRRFERRVVTVQADAGIETQRTDEIEYHIRDLSGLVND